MTTTTQLADMCIQNHYALLQRSHPARISRHAVPRSGWSHRLRCLPWRMCYSCCRMLCCSWSRVRHCPPGWRPTCCAVLQYYFRFLLCCLRCSVIGTDDLTQNLLRDWEWASEGGVGRRKMRQNARVKVVVQFEMPALVLWRARRAHRDDSRAMEVRKIHLGTCHSQTASMSKLAIS